MLSSFITAIRSQTGSIVFLVLIAAAIALGLLRVGYWLILRPQTEKQNYTKLSPPVILELEQEIKLFKEDNFQSANKIVATYSEAKTLIGKHIADLKQTESSVSASEAKYRSIKVPLSMTGSDQKIKEIFASAHRLIANYGTQLNFRRQVSEGFGDELDQVLTEFTDLAHKGGNSGVFAIKSQRIVQLSARSLDRLKGITQIPKDEEFEYKFRLDYLTSLNEAFTRLSQYYISADINAAMKEVETFSNLTIQKNAEYKQLIKNYTENSSTAKDFITLEVSLQEIMGKLVSK